MTLYNTYYLYVFLYIPKGFNIIIIKIYYTFFKFDLFSRYIIIGRTFWTLMSK